MTIEYEQTPEDVVAFNLFHMEHSPAARWNYRKVRLIRMAWWFVGGSGLWCFAIVLGYQSLEAGLYVIPFYALGLVDLFLYPRAYRGSIIKLVSGMCRERNNRGLFGTQQITLSADGVSNGNAFERSAASWDSIEEVAVSSDYVYIYRNAIDAVIIPRRAFPTEIEFDGFIESARRFHERAAQSSVR
ncbi:MAG: YcxB family protein [Planctomycetales bacterium]